MSVYCDWVRWKVWSAASISVWQHVKLSVQIRPWDTLACCWDKKQPTNKQFHVSSSLVCHFLPVAHFIETSVRSVFLWHQWGCSSLVDFRTAFTLTTTKNVEKSSSRGEFSVYHQKRVKRKVATLFPRCGIQDPAFRPPSLCELALWETCIISLWHDSTKTGAEPHVEVFPQLTAVSSSESYQWPGNWYPSGYPFKLMGLHGQHWDWLAWCQCIVT